MTLAQRLLSWVGIRNAAPPAVRNPETGIQYPWAFEAGVYVSPLYALQVSAVYACCRVIVDSLAPAPWKVYSVDGPRKTPAVDDPIGYILNTRANPWTTSQAVREALLWTVLTGDGNAYALIERDFAGRVIALWPIPSESVLPYRSPDTGELAYRISNMDGGASIKPARDVLHVRGPSFTGYVGDSVVSRAAKGIGLAQAAQVHSASYFANGTRLSGYLTTDQVLTKDQITDLGAEWNAKYSGPNKVGSTAVLMKGTKYEQMGADAASAQLLETRRFQVEEISRWFGVPLNMINDPQGAQGYGTNQESAFLGFVKTTLTPWATRLDQEASFKLFPQRAPWREVKHDLSGLTRGDFKTRMESYAIGLKAGVMTRNETREEEGLNDSGPDGDVFLVDSSLKRLEDVLDPPEPQAAAMPAGASSPDAAPADPAEPDEDDAEDAPMNARPGVVYSFAAHMLAKQFERYAGRVKGKDADERARQREWLAADCCRFVDLARDAGLRARSEDILVAAAALDAGASAAAEAERIVSAWRVA